MKSYWKTLYASPFYDAEDGAGTGGAPDPTTQPPEPTPTFDDILKTPAFQAEFDRRVTKALETGKAKWEKDAQARVSEAEKLAKMTAEQKAQHEREKREQELAEREMTLTKREMRAQAAETLAQKGLSAALLDTLDYSSAEACASSIDGVEKAFRAAVQAGVEERMRGKPPAAPATPQDLSALADADYYKTIMQKK